MSEHTWRELERADMDAAAAHAVETESRAERDSGRTSELKPCPFCGGEAKPYNLGEKHLIECDDCKEYGHGAELLPEMRREGGGRMSEYRPTEYVVDFGDYRSNQFVRLNMALIEQNSAKLSERIVRCRDCKHGHEVTWQTGSEIPSDYRDCTGPLVETWDYYHDEPKDNPVPPEGFCKWGERRES